MRIRRIVTAVGLALTMSIGTTACAGTVGHNSSSASTFTYANTSTMMVNWDPGSSNASGELIVMANMYETLTRYDSASKTVQPLLATAWTNSDDGKTWTFTLREGVNYSTGRPMTAESAKQAVLRTQSLKSGGSYIWDSVETIDTPSPDTMVFNLRYPAAIDLIASSSTGAWIYDTQATAGDLTKWFSEGNAAGTGPYLVDTWNRGQENELRLKANVDYWQGWDDKKFKRVLFKSTPQATTMLQQLQSNDVTFSIHLTPELSESLKGSAALTTTETPSLQNLIAMFNTESGPLSDTRVRQAVQQSIDYESIVTALHGGAINASGFVPEGLLGYDPNLAVKTDPAAAKALLSSVGYGTDNPLKLKLTFLSSNSAETLTAQLLKSSLAVAGIELETRGLEYSAQAALAQSVDVSQRQDIFLFFWYPDYADPVSWFQSLFHSAEPVSTNFSYLNDSNVDSSIEQLKSITATDRYAANQGYIKLQKDLIDKAVAAPLFVSTYQRVYQSNLKGYIDNPAYPNVVFVYDVSQG